MKQFMSLSKIQIYRHPWKKLRDSFLKMPSVKKVNWCFNKPKLPVLDDGSVNLHLGCGEVCHPAFINIDLIPYPHVHYVQPINDLSNFADESVDLIYASHCLEHFPFRLVHFVLSEWFRVLKRGGVIRLSVPDFDAINDVYLASGRNLDHVQKAIVGGQDYNNNFHYVVFNEKNLVRELEDVGFSQIKKWVPGTTLLTTFDDWSDKNFLVGDKFYPISLNLEASKNI